jgi:inactivated superfamily I helicase
VRTSNYNFGKNNMRKLLILAATGLTLTFINSSVNAQVDLSAYADAEGYIDVQALTCAQLAGTWQDQADLLTTWYSGWYNGLAKKHYINIARSKETEHEVIVYCKANPVHGEFVNPRRSGAARAAL